MLNGLDEHARGAAGRVVRCLALFWVEDVHHQSDHASRRIELARLLVGQVGKPLDQVFVGLTEDVWFDQRIRET